MFDSSNLTTDIKTRSKQILITVFNLESCFVLLLIAVSAGLSLEYLAILLRWDQPMRCLSSSQPRYHDCGLQRGSGWEVRALCCVMETKGSKSSFSSGLDKNRLGFANNLETLSYSSNFLDCPNPMLQNKGVSYWCECFLTGLGTRKPK